MSRGMAMFDIFRIAIIMIARMEGRGEYAPPHRGFRQEQTE